MADNADLQARIAALACQINQHKQQKQQPQQSPGRWAPYARGRRAGHQQPHKNRTLVLGGTQNPVPPLAPSEPRNQDATAFPDVANPLETFVSAQGPGKMQLMNRDTFQREQKQLLEQRQRARAAKRQKIDHKERATLMHQATASPNSGSRELIIEGIRFQLRNDGSKLIRIQGTPPASPSAPIINNKFTVPDAGTGNQETPKTAKIADVDFYRTKNGNLVRANAVRDLVRYRPYKSNFSNEQHLPDSKYRPANRRQTTQCKHFTKHGTGKPLPIILVEEDRQPIRGTVSCLIADHCLGKCPYGPSCRFSHDPSKVAMCKTFLHTGSCAAGDSCDLSHTPTYHRVPACNHFLRGKCTKDPCPFPHVHVSPSAFVCRPFALLGYCSNGEDCIKRHVFECPDYSNSGYCANRESGKCPLPHPDHASALRKAAARQAKTDIDDNSDLSSDDEARDDTGMEDIDSDEAEDIIMGDEDLNHALSQQHDFVAFS